MGRKKEFKKIKLINELNTLTVKLRQMTEFLTERIEGLNNEYNEDCKDDVGCLIDDIIDIVQDEIDSEIVDLKDEMVEALENLEDKFKGDINYLYDEAEHIHDKFDLEITKLNKKIESLNDKKHLEFPNINKVKLIGFDKRDSKPVFEIIEDDTIIEFKKETCCGKH